MDVEKTQKDCEFIGELLREQFPNFMVKVGVRQLLGQTVQVTIANVPGKEYAPYGILENASFLLMALVHENRDGSCYMERPSHLTRNITFRKISGKDHSTVVAKFYDWMMRNRDEILAIPPRYRHD